MHDVIRTLISLYCILCYARWQFKQPAVIQNRLKTKKNVCTKAGEIRMYSQMQHCFLNTTYNFFQCGYSIKSQFNMIKFSSILLTQQKHSLHLSSLTKSRSKLTSVRVVEWLASLSHIKTQIHTHTHIHSGDREGDIFVSGRMNAFI